MANEQTKDLPVDCPTCWGYGIVTCKERPGINGRAPIFTCPVCLGSGKKKK